MNLKNYIFIFIISLFISVYAFEVFLLLKNNQNFTNNKLQNKIELLNELKKQNKKVSFTISPSNFINEKNLRIFPVSGLSNHKTINCNENGYYSIYQSDRYGFNNPDKNWNYDKIEYLLLGDSFTHGSCVNRPNDIASVLSKLSNEPTINLGYNANGPLLMLVSLKEYFNLNTKKVLWVYYEGNDLANLSNEINSLILKKYLQDPNFKQNLKVKQKEIDKKLKLKLKEILSQKKNNKKLKKEKIKYQILKFLRLDKTKNALFLEKKFIDRDFENFKRILISANRFVEMNEAKLYFVYLPEFSRYKKKIYINKSYLEIKKIVENLKIEFIDIHTEFFKNKKNPLEFFASSEFNSHYNVKGYDEIAKIIYKISKE